MSFDAVQSLPDERGALKRAAGAIATAWPSWLAPLMLLAVMVLPWVSAWDHPLHTPDEGRYGTVSAAMAASGDWMVPVFRGAPHLTKPPLVYWLQAGAIHVFGRSEIALRVPSLVAGSLACLVVFLFVRRMRGVEMATIAVALYGVMPLPLVFARMASIDGLLNFFWTTALVCGAIAIDAKRHQRAGALGWLALAWLAVAFGALAKGPIAPAPMAIIGAWLLLARRWSDLRWFALHGLWGAILACAPVAAWVIAIARHHPEAMDIWRAQFIDRFMVGLPAQPLLSSAQALSPAAELAEGTDHEPFWFYLPILVVGMMPATCAMTLPWFNLRLREALRAFTLGDLRALLLVAVVAPLLFFSVAKGKMPAYIVPVAAPMAILVAGMLARVVGASAATPRTDAPLADGALAIAKEPDVRLTFALAMILGVIGAAIAGGILGGRWGAKELLAFVPVPMLAMFAVWQWRRGTEGRRSALLTMWTAMVLVALLMFRLEHRTLLDRDMGARAMIERVRAITGSDHPQVVIYNFRNPTIDFYAGSDPLMVWSESDLRGLWPKLRPDHAILVPLRTWNWIETACPRLAEAFVPLARETDGDADQPSGAIWNRWPGKPTMILRMQYEPGQDADRDAGSIPPEPHD